MGGFLYVIHRSNFWKIPAVTELIRKSETTAKNASILDFLISLFFY